MFAECTSLTEAPVLPATNLDGACYERMFTNCTNLTKVPDLPATNLASMCYRSMFEGCTSLTEAPELPATNLAFACYMGMFRDCSKLNYVKALFINTSSFDLVASFDTAEWLWNVSSTGTFVKNKDATWSRSECGIPDGWTIIEE